MPRPKVESRPRAWPRVLVLALVGIGAAGCSDSARFESSSYSSDRPIPTQDVSSISPPPPPGRAEAHPLPALPPPATVTAAPGTYGAQGSSSHRSSGQYSDITGSTATIPPASSHWTRNGGSAVTVGYGETVDSIARKHGVPSLAILQTNGIREAAQVRPGQLLVIPLRHQSPDPAS